MATYVHEMVHSGAETLSNQLTQTAVARAGRSGVVAAAFVSSDGTNTARLVGRDSGAIIIPEGSHAVQKTLADVGPCLQEVLYRGKVKPGEELDLEVTAAGASTSVVLVMVD